MIPTAYQDDLTQDFTIAEKPWRTFKMGFQWLTVRGEVDGLEAIQQAIYCILHVERYQWPIYSWDYGVELVDLIGQDPDLVKVEAQRRISEALLQDDRILAVNDFVFTTTKRKQLLAQFTVSTTLGNVEAEMEVNA